jgi:formamidase
MALIEILPDTSRSLVDAPSQGHNRWHWDIEPVAECRSGDDLVFATRDALDGQIDHQTCNADLDHLDVGRIHPLTGPVFIADAEPGDLLEIEVGEVTPAPYGFTSQRPGLGLLSGSDRQSYVVHWELEARQAVSGQLPGVRVPRAPFLGIVGLAPSEEVVSHARRHEADLGFDPIRPGSAVPETVAKRGLRTGPPRSNGGNIDIRQLGPGARLFIPVQHHGGLLSVGDAHFAQGDGEVCGTAIEMRSTSRVRVRLHKNASRSGIAAWCPPSVATSTSSSFSVLGLATDRDDSLRGAAVSAIEQLVERLAEAYGFEDGAAFALCSVAADLSISQIVNEPNPGVTASIRMDIFEDRGERLMQSTVGGD